MKNWPEWWDWELEISPHLLKRMVDRSFSETDLRSMLERATGLRRDVEPLRWIVETMHDSRVWQVIVELDTLDELLVVITAFPVEP